MSLLPPQLEAFIYVAKTQSVRRAAEHLHLTQTAVTQRIRSIEKQLNTSLFARTHRGMLLTPEGETLLRYCKATLDLEQQTLDTIQGSGKAQPIELSITGPTSIMTSRIIPQCIPVMKTLPNLIMNFDITDKEDRYHYLREGEHPLAVLQQEHTSREMETKVLKPEEYVLVCTSDWQHRSLPEILQSEYIVDYNEGDQMTFNYLKHYQLIGQANTKRHFANRTESLANLIVAGLGYGLLTKEYSLPFIENGQMITLNDQKIFTNQQCLAWYPRPNYPPYLQRIIEAIN